MLPWLIEVCQQVEIGVVKDFVLVFDASFQGCICAPTFLYQFVVELSSLLVGTSAPS